MAFSRLTGQRDVRTCLAGSTLAKGDIVQMIEATGSGTVDNAATNVPVYGVTLEAITSGSTGLVDRIHNGDVFKVKVNSGTVAASTVFKFADISDETGITLTPSNNDVRVVGWDGATTNVCYVELTTPEVSAGTASV